MPDLCRGLGISSALFYRWRAKYGGMDVSMMARMKELEEENRRLRKMIVDERLKALEAENSKLKRLLAESLLDNAALKDVVGRKW